MDEPVSAMSKPDPRGDNPNATIQLSALDAAELVQFDTPDPVDGAAEPPRSRAAPPPLPPALPVAGTPPPKSAEAGGGRSPVLYGAVFVVLLAGAVAAGLAVGRYARARRASAEPAPTASPVATALPAPVTTAAPPVSAAPRTLTIPTIEVTSPAP
jgi:hypothetical protein